MTCFHGCPITPDEVAIAALKGRHAMVSFAYPDQIEIVSDVVESMVIDSGIFTTYKSGGSEPDWDGYFRFVDRWRKHPSFDWAVMPDSITGSESYNDELEKAWPFKFGGVPVWHLHESLGRLERMIEQYGFLAIGSSGQWATPCTPRWWGRIGEVMDVLCNENGWPRCQFHMLRGLDERIKMRVPAKSGDSTNIGQNVGIDKKWVGSYQPKTKKGRALVMIDRIESTPSASQWLRMDIQQDFWAEAVNA